MSVRYFLLNFYAWKNSSSQLLPSRLKYWREDGFWTDALFDVVTHFQVLSVMFTEYKQNVDKWYLTGEALFGKMGGVYVTEVANVDKGQGHVCRVWCVGSGQQYGRSLVSTVASQREGPEFDSPLRQGLSVWTLHVPSISCKGFPRVLRNYHTTKNMTICTCFSCWGQLYCSPVSALDPVPGRCTLAAHCYVE